MKQCDRCENEARYMRHDMETGEVLQLCPDCAGGPVADATTSATPPLCQLCDLEPTQVLLTTPSDGASLALGEFCHHVMMRVRWLQLAGGVREELQPQVDAAISGEVPAEEDEAPAPPDAPQLTPAPEAPADDEQSQNGETPDTDAAPVEEPQATAVTN